jgi:succinoglycan biosynthesis protein ExoW
MPSVSVVIPYYQREAGPLVRAPRSALRQRDVETPAIIVVDDGSPLPAAAEIATLDPSERAHVTLLRQPNQGPGPARNRGLDAVSRDAEWIAFLDSDDVWEERHLARGITAPGHGYDFFFANLMRDGDADTHFGLAGFAVPVHRALAADTSLFAYCGDFFSANLRCSPVGKSTVILRNSVLGSLRFPETRDTPGEDGTAQVRYGRGNITNSDNWKSVKSLRTNLAYGAYIANIVKRFSLNEAQAAVVRQMRRANCEATALILVAMLRDRRWPEPAMFGACVRRHPTIITDMLRVLCKAGFSRLSARRSVPRNAVGARTGDRRCG